MRKLRYHLAACILNLYFPGEKPLCKVIQYVAVFLSSHNCQEHKNEVLLANSLLYLLKRGLYGLFSFFQFFFSFPNLGNRWMKHILCLYFLKVAPCRSSPWPFIEFFQWSAALDRNKYFSHSVSYYCICWNLKRNPESRHPQSPIRRKGLLHIYAPCGPLRHSKGFLNVYSEIFHYFSKDYLIKGSF